MAYGVEIENGIRFIDHRRLSSGLSTSDISRTTLRRYRIQSPEAYTLHCAPLIPPANPTLS